MDCAASQSRQVAAMDMRGDSAWAGFDSRIRWRHRVLLTWLEAILSGIHGRTQL
jgi:hypothetical protein